MAKHKSKTRVSSEQRFQVRNAEDYQVTVTKDVTPSQMVRRSRLNRIEDFARAKELGITADELAAL